MTTVLILLLLVPGTFILLTIGAGHYAFSITPRPSENFPDSLNMSYRDIYFRNNNKETLHGWWIPHPEKDSNTTCPTVVLLHGWNRNSERMLPYLEQLKELPLNLLVFEGRGHGENTKNRFISQVGFGQDVSAAIDWLVLQPEVDVRRIGVLGHSIGAAATIYATRKDLRIKTFVADSSYAHPREIISRQLDNLHIPFFPVGWLVQQYIQLRLGTTFDKVAPEAVIGKINQPGLLIHGDKDTVVPVDDAYRIQNNVQNNISLWVAEGYGHSNTTNHPDFGEILRNFLTRYLLNTSNGKVKADDIGELMST